MKEPRKSPPSKPQSKAEDKLDEELEESFPASDPPSNTPTASGGPERPQTKPPKPGKSPRRRGGAGRRRPAPTLPALSMSRILSSSVTQTLLTTAARGPLRISATSASTATDGPEIRASTAPSDLLRTQPETPSLIAARRANSR